MKKTCNECGKKFLQQENELHAKDKTRCGECIVGERTPSEAEKKIIESETIKPMPGGISKQMPVSEWGKSFSNLYENDDFAERIKLCLDELTIEKTLKKGEKAVFLDPAGAQYFAEINESGNIKYKKAYSRRDYRMRYNQYIDNIKNSGIWPNYFSDEE